jgi:hypothetical protein
MKSDQLSFRPGFHLSAASAKSQAAVMVSAVGGKEGGSDNLHKGADQWVVRRRRVERCDRHRSRFAARRPAVLILKWSAIGQRQAC